MTTHTEFKLQDLLELCASADVALNCATKVEKNGLALAVYHLDDGYFVTDDQCTHGPGSLSEGYIDGGTVECDFHNGAFDIRTGEVVTPPCMIPLRTYAVHTADGKIYIDPNQPALAAGVAGACPRRQPE